jgi:hypothetical protein
MKKDLINYAILEIPELNMTSGKMAVKDITPELFYGIGNKKLTFACKRSTPSVMYIGKKPPKNFKCGRIGWYQLRSIA